MKSSTAWGIGLGTVAVFGIGAVALRKPKRTNGNGGGQQGGGASGSSPGPIPTGESRQISHKGCVGTLLHLPVPDEMGNTYLWTVHRGAPENTLVASGATKGTRAQQLAELAMWKALKWQICQPTPTQSSGVAG